MTYGTEQIQELLADSLVLCSGISWYSFIFTVYVGKLRDHSQKREFSDTNFEIGNLADILTECFC